MISLADVSERPVIVEEWLRELVPCFLDNRRRDVETMLAALAREDYEAIRVLARAMRGVAGSVGFAAVDDLGRAIEDAARVQGDHEIRDGALELEKYLECVRVIYR
jgi:HPt (histidine-containing phosphotransfer) domain-containing protein